MNRLVAASFLGIASLQEGEAWDRVEGIINRSKYQHILEESWRWGRARTSNVIIIWTTNRVELIQERKTSMPLKTCGRIQLTKTYSERLWWKKCLVWEYDDLLYIFILYFITFIINYSFFFVLFVGFKIPIKMEKTAEMTCLYFSLCITKLHPLCIKYIYTHHAV